MGVVLCALAKNIMGCHEGFLTWWGIELIKLEVYLIVGKVMKCIFGINSKDNSTWWIPWKICMASLKTFGSLGAIIK